MAIRVAKAFGGTPEVWMRVQHQYDLSKIDERAKQIKIKPYKGALEPAYQ
jgi:plasmid maintenance system antidote protein VapI